MARNQKRRLKWILIISPFIITIILFALSQLQIPVLAIGNIRWIIAVKILAATVLGIIGTNLFLGFFHQVLRAKHQKPWIDVHWFGLLLMAFFLLDSLVVNMLLSILPFSSRIVMMLVPVTFFTIFASLRWGQGSAILIGISCALIAALKGSLEYMLFIDMPVFFSTFVSGLTASFIVYRIMHRGTFLRAGIISGFSGSVTAAASMILFLEGFINQDASLMWHEVKVILLEGSIIFIPALAVGIVYYFLLSPFEKLLNFSTNIEILPFDNQDNKLLRAMSKEALGTYHHCQTVAHLASASTESIGANSLLARVGAYYHDIGKMMSPEYFTENIQAGTDKQQKLSPEKGASIIFSHTYNGLIYGSRYRLPQKILDIINQHHGTSLLKGFYYRALKQSKGKKETPDIDSFSYKGPRPQSLEAAIVMISDCIEAASRKMKNPTSDKIRKLINEVIADQIDQNQFAESGLNFRHLETIKKTLAIQLIAIFHNRMKKK